MIGSRDLYKALYRAKESQKGSHRFGVTLARTVNAMF